MIIILYRKMKIDLHLYYVSVLFVGLILRMTLVVCLSHQANLFYFNRSLTLSAVMVLMKPHLMKTGY